MIYSMTGYGAARVAGSRFVVGVEIKSLNSKSLEFYLRAPAYYMQQEIWIKNQISARLVRGKITVVVTVEDLGDEAGTGNAEIDFDRIKQYAGLLAQIQKELNLTQETPLATLLTLPGVVKEKTPNLNDEEWTLTQQALDQAIAEINASRKQEGAALEADVVKNIQSVTEKLTQIEAFEGRRVETLKVRLENQLRELADNIPVHDERFQQELIYYLEKFDVNEEKVRIAAHLKTFQETMAEENQGRKLVFIVQELWREVNTLGVKAFDVDIQKIVVEMKEELEKVKEQLMNVL